MDDPDLDVLPVSLFCECFPGLSELLKSISKRCQCRTCRRAGAIDDWKEGCLCAAALDYFFMLIGNAIVDGFGVEDSSGLMSYSDYVHEV